MSNYDTNEDESQEQESNGDGNAPRPRGADRLGFKIGSIGNDQVYSKNVDDVLKMPAAVDCVYTSCYCEENVWKLCDYVRHNQIELLDYCFAVFISNAKRVIPIWMQKCGSGTDKVIFWDYHVIFMFNTGECACVYDLDSCLPFPTDFRLYCNLALRSDDNIAPECHRKVRVVPAEMYLELFASDRSHMKKRNGNWRHPPPPYPAIMTPEYTNNIQDFISMDHCIGFGEVMNLYVFLKQYSPGELRRDQTVQESSETASDKMCNEDSGIS